MLTLHNKVIHFPPECRKDFAAIIVSFAKNRKVWTASFIHVLYPSQSKVSELFLGFFSPACTKICSATNRWDLISTGTLLELTVMS